MKEIFDAYSLGNLAGDIPVFCTSALGMTDKRNTVASMRATASRAYAGDHAIIDMVKGTV